MSDCKWHRLDLVEPLIDGEIKAYAVVDENFLWFNGHFDDMPILPGIGEIAMVLDAIEKGCGMNNPPGVFKLDKVRFRRIVKPGDRLEISVKTDPLDNKKFRFRIETHGELACNGNVEVR
jgi:3-hydroxymyristoyl/3-hydroxydecanoyl-(acyl carrier protein) dehydratase